MGSTSRDPQLVHTRNSPDETLPPVVGGVVSVGQMVDNGVIRCLNVRHQHILELQ